MRIKRWLPLDFHLGGGVGRTPRDMAMNKMASVALMTITFLIVLFIFFHLSLPGMVPWDEAGYIWQGYQAHEALKAGDWQQFWQLTKSQFYYPFFQSWYLGLATLFFGYTISTARFVSLLLLLPTVWLVWQITIKISQKNLWPATSAIFFLLTSPLVLYYFSTVMKEGLGMVLTLLCFWLYFKAREEKKSFWFFLTGLACLTLALIKYNYGVLVLVVLGVESLLWRHWRKNLMLFLPVTLGLIYWLFPPGNLKWFWEILQNKWQVNLYETTTLGHLLYYPIELAFSYFFSWPAFLLATLGFIYSFKNWRNFRIRVLVGLFLFNFILAEKHMMNNQARFIFTSFPAFLIVGSVGLVALAKEFRQLLRQPLWLGIGIPFLLVGGVVILGDLLILPKILRPTASHQVETALFYEKDYQNIRRFNFHRPDWPHIPADKNNETVNDVFAFIFRQIDLSKNINLVGQANEFSPDLFRFNLAKAKRKGGFGFQSNKYQEYFVTLGVQSGDRFDTADFRRANLTTVEWVRQTLADPSLESIAKKLFPDLGIEITILGRP